MWVKEMYGKTISHLFWRSSSDSWLGPLRQNRWASVSQCSQTVSTRATEVKQPKEQGSWSGDVMWTLCHQTGSQRPLAGTAEAKWWVDGKHVPGLTSWILWVRRRWHRRQITQTSRKAAARSLRTKLEMPVGKAFPGVNKRQGLCVSGVSASFWQSTLMPRNYFWCRPDTVISTTPQVQLVRMAEEEWLSSLKGPQQQSCKKDIHFGSQNRSLFSTLSYVVNLTGIFFSTECPVLWEK